MVRHAKMTTDNISQFQKHIFSWYKTHKRDDLPWRWTKKRPVEPYRILVSEIMLQQTQVPRVLIKFDEFIKEFPTLESLAKARLERVLRAWQGLGYNRRGLYLKRAAEQVLRDYNGVLPADPSLLRTLPGVGPYTAGAIACFAHNKPVVFLDTNIRKVFIHHFFTQKKKISDTEILPIAEKVLYRKDPRTWNYALMDYGAIELPRTHTLLQKAKSYHKQSKFKGSTRYYRAQIVKYLLEHKRASIQELQKVIPLNTSPLLATLCRDGLIEEKSRGIYRITFQK